jgi:hypothetical protein
MRKDGSSWTKNIGRHANAATLNLGFTYALDSRTALVTIPGTDRTPDVSDFTLACKIPYMF